MATSGIILTTLVVCMNCIVGIAYTQDQVPDDTVWTPPSATFFYGQPNANITCKFVGNPYGVYWMKGSSPATAETLVSFAGGRKTGPWHDAGVATISDDYSLVFTNIQAEHAGNYICRVSNHHGFLIVNNTEVRVLDPEQVSIFTEPNVIGWAGAFVSLQCTFLGIPERVLWNRVQGDPKTKSVETVLRYSSGGYEVLARDRRYSWSDSYGLIIRDLQVLDEGNFTCMVSKQDGTEIQNTTVHTVHAKAKKPYIQISECESQPEEPTNGTDPTPCVYNLTEDNDFFQLRCSVLRVKPQVHLIWQEGSNNLSAAPIVSQRSDGAFDVTATITRRTNQSSFTFTCIASGIAVDGAAQRTVTVHVTKLPKGPASKTGLAVGLSILLILLIPVLIVIIFVIYRGKEYVKLHDKPDIDVPAVTGEDVESQPQESHPSRPSRPRRVLTLIMSREFIRWVFRRKEHYHAETDEEQPLEAKEDIQLEQLREGLKCYTPGKKTSMSIDVRAIHIGVFGVMSAGKSSFVNSLNFAFKNEYYNVAAEADFETSGSRTKYRDSVPLTQHIHVIDNRGMKEFSSEQISKDLIPQIRGKRGIDPDKKVKEGKEIHCPVLVCNLSQPTHRKPALDFIQMFSQQVYDLYGRFAMIVLTHEDDLNRFPEADGTAEDVKELVKKTAEIPGNFIWTFENYTESSHEHDTKKSIRYLKFLEQCLDVGERNILFQTEMKAEKHASRFFGRFKKKKSK